MNLTARLRLSLPPGLAGGIGAVAVAAAGVLLPASPAQAWYGDDFGPDEKIEWPLPPPFVAGRREDGSLIVVKVGDLEREVRQHSPQLVGFWAPHHTHVAIDGAWLSRAVDAYEDLLFNLGIRYTPDVWDCENYAQLLSTLVGLEMAKLTTADVRPPIGWFKVLPEVAWGGIPADRLHALVLVRTQEGMEVIEPQTGERVRFADYPNRHRVLEVYFE